MVQFGKRQKASDKGGRIIDGWMDGEADEEREVRKRHDNTLT